MNLSLNPYWQSVAAPWRQRANEGNWLGPVGLAATLLLLGVVILFAGEFSRKAALVTRNAKILAALNNKSTAEAYRLSVSASKILTLFQIPFHRYASWLLARPDSGPAHALARAELGLGAKTHWVMQVINICATCALVGLGAFAYERMWGNAWVTLANPISILFLGVMSLAPLANWRTTLLVSAKEQSLMLLLPGMPQGVALNRALAKRHLRHLLVFWMAMTAVLLFAPWPEFLRAYAGVLSVLTLPLLPLVVQDWSRVAPLTPWQVVAMMVKGIVWMPGMLLVLHLLHVPLLWLALLSTVVCVPTVVWRWHRLAGFAQAFPVGQRVKFSQ